MWLQPPPEPKYPQQATGRQPTSNASSPPAHNGLCLWGWAPGCTKVSHTLAAMRRGGGPVGQPTRPHNFSGRTTRPTGEVSDAPRTPPAGPARDPPAAHPDAANEPPHTRAAAPVEGDHGQGSRVHPTVCTVGDAEQRDDHDYRDGGECVADEGDHWLACVSFDPGPGRAHFVCARPGTGVPWAAAGGGMGVSPLGWWAFWVLWCRVFWLSLWLGWPFGWRRPSRWQVSCTPSVPVSGVWRIS